MILEESGALIKNFRAIINILLIWIYIIGAFSYRCVRSFRFARVFAVFFSFFISRKAFASPRRAVGHWNGCIHTCGNTFTDLFGCSASGTGRNYRTRRASWVTRRLLCRNTRAAFECNRMCTRCIGRTILSSIWTLFCDPDVIVVYRSIASWRQKDGSPLSNKIELPESHTSRYIQVLKVCEYIYAN